MAGMLTALGTGIGGFMAGYRQQQQAMDQLQKVGLQLKQAQQQQQGQSLIGEALAAGNIPGLGGGPVGGGLPGSTPTPPIPGQPSVAAQPLAPPPQPENPYAPALSPAQPPPQNASLTPTGGEEVSQPLDEPPPVASGTTPAPPQGGAPPADSGVSAGGVADQGQNQDGLSALRTAFASLQTVDPQAIAKRIKEVRPDADPAAIAYATEQIVKMAQGGNPLQKIYAASVAHELHLDKQIAAKHEDVQTQQAGATQRAQLGADTRLNVVGQQQAGANQRNINTVTGANERAAAGREAAAARSQAIQDRIDARFNQSMQTRQMSVTQKAQAQQVANSYKNIVTQISAIKGQIAFGMTTPAQQAQLQALQNQAITLYGQLVKMGVAIDTPKALLDGADQAGKVVPIAPATPAAPPPM